MDKKIRSSQSKIEEPKIYCNNQRYDQKMPTNTKNIERNHKKDKII